MGEWPVIAIAERRGKTITDTAGRTYLSFAGTDYLGLSSDATVCAAAGDALRRFGLGASASPRTTGHTEIHRRAETAYARFKAKESAVLLASGYLAPRAAIEALTLSDDFFVVDERAHPALLTAIPAGAAIGRFAHFDVRDAKRVAGKVPGDRRIVLLAEAVDLFGEVFDLAALRPAFGDRPHLVIIDNAHGAGVLGMTGRGLAERAAWESDAVVECDSLAKAFGAFGGVIAGSREAVARIRERSYAYGGATALPPLAAAAVEAAVGVHASGDPLLRLRENVRRLGGALRNIGLAVTGGPHAVFAITDPGDGHECRVRRLLDCGIFPSFGRYPSALGPAFLRLVVTAAHDEQDILRLVEVLRD